MVGPTTTSYLCGVSSIERCTILLPTTTPVITPSTSPTPTPSPCYASGIERCLILLPITPAPVIDIIEFVTGKTKVNNGDVVRYSGEFFIAKNSPGLWGSTSYTYNACSGWQGERLPCTTDKSYFGRGVKQLSWNYNYDPFSEAMFGNKAVLLENPGLVADTWLNLASAVFLYVYPQPPKPSMLHVIDGTWQPNATDKAAGIDNGFGATIQITNGAFECNKAATSNQAKNRIAYYK